MKKSIAIFSAISLACVSVPNAQDIISRGNGLFIQAKITEIGSSDIKYLSVAHLEGPIYTIPKKEVFKIIYANGTEEILNESYNGLFLKSQTELLRKHEDSVTSGQGIKALKSASYRTVVYSDNEKNPNELNFKSYRVPGYGYRVESEELITQTIRREFVDSKREIHSGRVQTIFQTKEGRWKQSGNDADGYELEKIPTNISIFRPVYSYFRGLELLVANQGDITYIGEGDIGAQHLHYFRILDGQILNDFWLDTETFLTVRYTSLGHMYRVSSSKRVKGFWFPTEVVEMNNRANRRQHYDLTVNEDLTEYLRIPDIEKLNDSLRTAKNLSINDFLKFGIGSNQKMVCDFLKKNRIKYDTTHVKSYEGDYTFICIGKGKLHEVSLIETDSLKYNFIDFHFVNDKLQSIRFAKYDSFQPYETEIQKLLVSHWYRCALQDKMIMKLNGKKQNSVYFWSKSKGDGLNRERKYSLKGSAMESALISFKKVEGNNVFCQELYLGLVKDLTYRDLGYVKNKN